MRLNIISDCAKGESSPYLIRLTIFSLFGWSLKLHVFLRGDADREFHDHPWSFWTLVLAGEYFEFVPEEQVSVAYMKKLRAKDRLGVASQEDAPTLVITRRVGSLDFRPARWKHRVLMNAPCATLVFTSPKVREWGFWKGRRFTHWRDFASARDC